MLVLEWVGFIAGVILVILAADSVLRTLVVPRGLSSTVSRRVAQAVRRIFLFLANRSSSYEVKDRIPYGPAPLPTDRSNSPTTSFSGECTAC